MSDVKLTNIPSMTVGKAVDKLSHAYTTVIQNRLPVKTMPSVMLWGPPGVGKSQAIRQIAKKIEDSTGKSVNVTDVRLLLFNPIDLRGIPTSNADKTLAVWLKPQIFQMDSDDNIVNILFLDEISAAPQSVQAAAYQITLDRVVGEHKLPDNCIVIAAGNRTTDKSVAFKMPKALANRLMHVEIEGSFKDIWDKHLADACESISIRDAITGRGTIPLLAERMWEEMRKPQTDWRTILNDFVQEEICDYSFAPPDRRFDESPFFLPDFNEKDETVEDILFMIDASGSMSNKDITAAYCEIKGAIEQFNGKLKGWLGFFDAEVIEPIPFENVEEFSVIRPKGGGGTDFQIIFEYVQKHMQDKLPASIIILTDGFAPFPQEKLAGGIPVLWLLNNDEVDPPWGKIARITV